MAGLHFSISDKGDYNFSCAISQKKIVSNIMNELIFDIVQNSAAFIFVSNKNFVKSKFKDSTEPIAEILVPRLNTLLFSLQDPLVLKNQLTV